MPNLPDNQDRKMRTENGSVSEDKAGTGRVNARRRFLKQAVAASPAVFTLFHGAARAQASAYQCIAKDAQLFEDEGGKRAIRLHRRTTQTDGWARMNIQGIQFERLDANGDGTGTVRVLLPYVGGTGTADPQLNYWYTQAWVQWEYLEGNSESHDPADILKLSNGAKYRSVGSMYDQGDKVVWVQTAREMGAGLVCVDDDGDFVSVSNPSEDDAGICAVGTGNPITTSCWGSFD